LPHCRGTPGLTGAAVMHDSKKRFWWSKKVGEPTIPSSSSLSSRLTFSSRHHFNT
jgi:hypothetical protein